LLLAKSVIAKEFFWRFGFASKAGEVTTVVVLAKNLDVWQFANAKVCKVKSHFE
jgi:hypothetical protein